MGNGLVTAGRHVTNHRGHVDSKPKQTGAIGEFFRTWGPPLLAVLLIRTFVFEPFRIPSGSMVPTLLIGDHVLVTKSSYGIYLPATVVEVPFTESLWVYPRYELLDLADPERGDVIVFRYPRDPQMNYIKRVVGIPGDRIQVKRGVLHINGEPQPRELAKEPHYAFTDQHCRTYKQRHYVDTTAGVQHDTLNALGDATSGSMRNTVEHIVPEDSVFVMGDNRDNSQDSRVWKFVKHNQIKGKAHFVWFSWDHCEGALRADRVFHGLYGTPVGASVDP